MAAEQLEHRFIVALPFYAIESWAYANIAGLRKLTAQSAELARINAWACDLGCLDDIEQLKDQLPSIRDRHNYDLVSDSAFPVQELLAVGKSYAKTVERLQSSVVVTEGLAETAAHPW